MARAECLLYDGEVLPVEVLAGWGVVNLLATDQQALRDKTQNRADKLANKSALVLRGRKRMMGDTENVSREQGLADEMDSLRKLCGSKDMEEGFSAFLAKRKPVFEGK